MIIKKLKTRKPFMYLWLKTVDGVNLYEHCARSLVGKYDNRVSADTKEIDNLKLENKIYYLCGVSKPYVWKNNFHLAFCPAKNKRIQVERNGVYIEIEGAEEILFNENDIISELPQSKRKEYYTCRNWQFANKVAKFIQ